MNRTGDHASLGLGRILLLLVALGFCASKGWAARFALQQAIPEVRLKDGRVLHGVTFISVGEASITGRWDGGRGSIPLVLLPDDVRGDLVPVKAGPAPPARLSNSPGVSETTADPVKLPTDIKLTNGFVMHQAKVVSWQADAMTVTYVGGKVLVKMDNIAPEQRMLFEAHKILFYERQARIDAARAARQAGADGTVSAEAQAAATEASHQALIRAGIAAHQLVVGMTQAEVIQAIGPPARTAGDAQHPDYVYWLYPGGGRGAKGAPCDRIVGFDKGIMDGWKDQ